MPRINVTASNFEEWEIDHLWLRWKQTEGFTKICKQYICPVSLSERINEQRGPEREVLSCSICMKAFPEMVFVPFSNIEGFEYENVYRPKSCCPCALIQPDKIKQRVTDILDNAFGYLWYTQSLESRLKRSRP